MLDLEVARLAMAVMQGPQGSNSMTSRWVSLWRWRLPLLLVTIILLGYGWLLADQWKSRTVVSGSSNPAVLCIQHRSGVSIEAYDWKAAKHWQRMCAAVDG